MFSIITPSFNYGRFLATCLESVQLQKVEHEHLIADNMSKDETLQILEQASFDGVSWWRAEDNGQSDALNKLLRRVRGDIVGWLNADEYYLPGAFELVHEEFTRHPHVDVVYGDTLFVDGTGRLERLLTRVRPSPFVLKHRGCYISTCSTFIRREAMQDFRFDTSLRHIMDWDLYLYLLKKKASFSYIRRPLGVFRAHDARVTAIPTPRTTCEHQKVRQRYGLTASPWLWRFQRAAADILYGTTKALEGGKRRERTAASFAGFGTLWPRDDDARTALDALTRRLSKK